MNRKPYSDILLEPMFAGCGLDDAPALGCGACVIKMSMRREIACGKLFSDLNNHISSRLLVEYV